MADQHVDLRRAFEGLVTDHTPTPRQMDAALLDLRREITQDVGPARQPKRWRVRLAAVAAVIVAFIVATSVFPSGQSTADANLLEIAAATRVLPATELPEGAYLYTENTGRVLGSTGPPPGFDFTEISYLIPIRVQSWVQGDSQLLRTTLGDPIFFDDETERFFYESGLAEIELPVRVSEVAQDGYTPAEDPSLWSTDVDTLRDQLTAAAELVQSGLPLEQRIIDAGVDLLEPSVQAPPQLRAAVIEVMASLDVETTKTADSEVIVSVLYEDEYFGSVVDSWILGPSGYLVGQELMAVSGTDDGVLPVGTVYSSIRWSEPAIAAEAGVVPDGVLP